MWVPTGQTLAHTTRKTRYTSEANSRKIIHSDITDHALSADTNGFENNMDFSTIDNIIPTNMYAHECVEIHLRDTLTIVFTYNDQPMENPIQGNERTHVMDKLRALFQGGKVIRSITTMENETLGSRYISQDGLDHVNITPLPGRTQVIMISFEDRDRLLGSRCPYYTVTKRTTVERNVNKHSAHPQVLDKVR